MKFSKFLILINIKIDTGLYKPNKINLYNKYLNSDIKGFFYLNISFTED